MRKLIFSLAVAAALSACGQNTYKVIAPVPDTDNGTIAYLINFDNGEKVDSTVVEKDAAVFTGDIDEPMMVQLVSNGNRMGNFILEQGTVAINQTNKRAVGSMLNDQLNQIVDNLNAISEKATPDMSEQEQMAVFDEFLSAMSSAIKENIDNPIGYYLFLSYANYLEPEEIDAFVKEYSDLAGYERVNDIMEANERVLATSEGKPFVDFEVVYDGKTQRLSDYVGNGKYTLVDFWASWCGPCIRELDVIKPLYEEYAPKGLQVVGVASWDQPEDTFEAIKKHQIPWDCIINAQSIGTDAYGIRGIPCIILFGPDGTIVSRGARGDGLKQVVKDAMEK